MLFDIERDIYREWYRDSSYTNFVVKISHYDDAHMTTLEQYYLSKGGTVNEPIMCQSFRMKAYMYGSCCVENIGSINIPDDLWTESDGYNGVDVVKDVYLKCSWAGLFTGIYVISVNVPYAYKSAEGYWTSLVKSHKLWNDQSTVPGEKKAHNVFQKSLCNVLDIDSLNQSLISGPSFGGMYAHVVYYVDESNVTHTISPDGEIVTVRFTRNVQGCDKHIRVTYRLGRWVRRYILSLTLSSMSETERGAWSSRDSFVEYMVNSIRGEVLNVASQNSDDIRIVEYEGEDIWNAYDASRYMRSSNSYNVDTGDLHDSCMRYDFCEERIRGWYGRALYGVCKCVAIIYDGKVIARALLWKVKGEGWMIDRIYGSDPAEKMLRKWALEQGMGTCKYVPGLMLDLSPDDKTRIISYFTGSEDNGFPYVDTFYSAWWKAGDVAITSNIRQGGIEAMNDDNTTEEEEFNRLGALQCTDGRIDYSASGNVWGLYYTDLAGRRSISGDGEPDYEDDDYDGDV